jgi:hypothetical protein
MQRYTFSSGNTLSDCYEMDDDGKHFSVNVLNGVGARFYGGGEGHATEFSISDGRYRSISDGRYIGAGGKSVDVGEIEDFYKEMSESLRHFSVQILGIGIPEWITGMPTRRQVRRDLKKIYTDARSDAISKEAGC